MRDIVEVINNISKSERNMLVEKLNDSDLFKFVPCVVLGEKGFVKTSIGWVKVREPKKNHPKYGDSYLAIGFISFEDEKGYVGELVNTEKAYFKDYHNRLKRIYLEFKK